MLPDGFVRGTSDNLPMVDVCMVFSFVRQDDRFSSMVEIRGKKNESSSREAYGDSAVGYVQLQRSGSLCTVKGKICPEHKLRKTPYKVTMVVDETEEKITSLECHDCEASQGGCKHGLAFMMWLHRRSEEAAPTEVISYWNKPRLATSGVESVLAEDVHPHNRPSVLPSNDNFLNDVLSMLSSSPSLLTMHTSASIENPCSNLGLYQLFVKLQQSKPLFTAEEFLTFASNRMDMHHCRKAFMMTQAQTESPLWHELRYGRITASKLHKAAKARKDVNSLTTEILGAHFLFETQAMARGKRLEPEILTEIGKEVGMKIGKCGIHLSSKYPLFGASPDGITKDFIVEIKCPSKESTVKNYLKEGEITDPVRAQMQLQMLMAEKKYGLLGVASPQFEQNKKITLVWEPYDSTYINNLISSATDYWKKNIFPKCLKSVT